MTQAMNVRVEPPPLPSVAVGDVIWVPVFAVERAGGAPFWLRVTAAGPVQNRQQAVRGVLVVGYHDASQRGEADRTVDIVLPLDRVARRIFTPG